MEKLEITLHPGTVAASVAEYLRLHLGVKARCDGNRLTVEHNPERVGARAILEAIRAFRLKRTPERAPHDSDEMPTMFKSADNEYPARDLNLNKSIEI